MSKLATYRNWCFSEHKLPIRNCYHSKTYLQISDSSKSVVRFSPRDKTLSGSWTIWDYESVWPDIWPQIICRALWPIFHGPLNSPYILKTVWCMKIILWNYESVWHSILPRNKCRSLWPIFHGPVIFPYILNSIWWMNVILLENK